MTSLAGVRLVLARSAESSAQLKVAMCALSMELAWKSGARLSTTRSIEGKVHRISKTPRTSEPVN